MMKFNPEALIEAYVYPVFRAGSEGELVTAMCWGSLGLALLTLLLPEATHGSPSSGSSSRLHLPGRVARVLRECPSLVVPLVLVGWGQQRAYKSVVNQLCLGMFIMHYFQRCFIFPFLLKNEKPAPLLPFFLSFLTYAYNGLLHGLYFVNYYHYSDEEWLFRPNFYIGFLVFLYGMKTNIGADSALRMLQTGKEPRYKVPTGGWFEKISCPNYFGEIVEMWGYALASLAPPALLHATLTTLVLGRRALHRHQWYIKKFEDYPQTRKAVFPFLL